MGVNMRRRVVSADTVADFDTLVNEQRESGDIKGRIIPGDISSILLQAYNMMEPR